MKIWKKLLQVERVHLEFIGSAIAFVVYSIKVFSSHDDNVLE